jgi:hypothetical protein
MVGILGLEIQQSSKWDLTIIAICNSLHPHGR